MRSRSETVGRRVGVMSRFALRWIATGALTVTAFFLSQSLYAQFRHPTVGPMRPGPMMGNSAFAPRPAAPIVNATRGVYNPATGLFTPGATGPFVVSSGTGFE